eukprot:404048-Prymnesium_polylepis.1
MCAVDFVHCGAAPSEARARTVVLYTAHSQVIAVAIQSSGLPFKGTAVNAARRPARCRSAVPLAWGALAVAPAWWRDRGLGPAGLGPALARAVLSFCRDFPQIRGRSRLRTSEE